MYCEEEYKPMKSVGTENVVRVSPLSYIHVLSSSSSSSSFSLSDFMDGFPNVGCSHLQVLP